MIALIQRVTEASVAINGNIHGAIDQGLLILLGVEKGDGAQEVSKLAQKVLGYRIFNDENGKMNLNVQQINGGLLIVPQFTLGADTRKGLRPGFSFGASPEQGKQEFERFVNECQGLYHRVATGVFGADMQVHLINDGPATFWLQIKPLK